MSWHLDDKCCLIHEDKDLPCLEKGVVNSAVLQWYSTLCPCLSNGVIPRPTMLCPFLTGGTTWLIPVLAAVGLGALAYLRTL